MLHLAFRVHLFEHSSTVWYPFNFIEALVYIQWQLHVYAELS